MRSIAAKSNMLSTAFAVALLLSALPALAQLPRRDLTVELRQIEDQQAQVLSTQPAVPLLAPQLVQVRNGEKASLRMGQTLPVRWVQSVAAQSGRSGTAGAVSYGLTWMDEGQNLAVTPRWAGGKQPVELQIDVQSASVDTSTGADLPNQQRSQLATTVSAPLGQWVTVAASGGGTAQANSYSSDAAADVRRLIQIRVLAR